MKLSQSHKHKLNRLTVGDYLNILILLFISFICIYPFWYVFIGTISNPNIPVRTLTFLPKDVTLFNYTEVFQMPGLIAALGISVLRTLTGTALAILLSSLLAYLFTLERMPARSFFYRLVIITMYISGGLIPTFLTYKSYGLTNNFLVYILPGAISAFNVVLLKTYIENSIPVSLSESAVLDGAGTMTIFVRIIFPLSVPIIATVALFCAVGQWNAWFDNMIYTSGKPQLMTLQYLLYRKLNEASMLAEASKSGVISQVGDILSKEKMLTPDSIRMTMTMLVTLPILFVYPFVQKYFVKGIMIGAVKG